jgi:hypothetical protein
MKEAELRKHATCDLCNQQIGHTGLPLFWRVTVERFGIDMHAVRRQTGLGMQIGAALAAVMGPDESMAQALMGPVVLTACETCAMERTGVVVPTALMKAEQDADARNEEQAAKR